MIAARLREVAAVSTGEVVIDAQASLSYIELMRAAAGIRHRLEQMGTRPGDFVMSTLPISIEAVATFVACAELGAVFVPVNPAWGQAELSWLLEQIRPAAVLAANDATWREAGIDAVRLLLRDADWPQPCDAEPVAQNWPAEHPLACVVSSGSTGRPKIAVKTHGMIAGIADSMAAACGIGPGNSLLATVPYFHGHGLANNLILPLLTRAKLILLEHFEPAAAAALIEKHAVDYLISSPVVFGLLAEADPQAFRSLRVCLCGGAPLPAQVKEKWRSICPIRQAYGSSEAGMIAIQVDRVTDPQCVGRPIPGTEIRIIEDDREQPAGQKGEIAVRGPGVIRGSELRFWNDFVRTGDLGWLDADGLLYVAGRLRPWINSGGVKVDPEEVQHVIGQIHGVRECRVEAEPGPGGRDIVAATIAADGVTRAAVIQHCRKHLAEYKIPRVLRFVAEIPKELTGKDARPWRA